MVIRRKKRKTRKRKSTRKNSSRMSAYRPKRRVKANAKRRRARGRKRPVVYKKRGGRLTVKKRSRLFKGKKASITRTNGRRRRSTRKNPMRALKTAISQKTLMTAAMSGAGLAAGFITLPLMYNFMPPAVKEQRKFFGLANVVLGGVLAASMKNKDAKTVGAAIAATGILDLIGSFVDFVPQIPMSNTLVGKMTGGALSAPVTAPAVPAPVETQSASYSPLAMSSSYEPAMMSASYDAAMLGADDPYEGVEW